MTLRRLVGISILVWPPRPIRNPSQQCRARRPRRPCLSYQPFRPIRQVKAIKPNRPRAPSICSRPRESRRRRSRPSSYIRPSRPTHSSHPSIRILYPPHGPTHALYSSHPFQDTHCNQARRNFLPGRIGYPSYPTRSNKYCRPLPPTHTFYTKNPGHAIGQMADDRT